MVKQQQNQVKTVQLAEGVLVMTAFNDICIPALRSGFAGYPVNPRWSGVKFHAWKTGRQWRQAVLQGEMTVRSTDSMLVSSCEVELPTDSESPQTWKPVSPLSILANRSNRQGELTLA